MCFLTGVFQYLTHRFPNAFAVNCGNSRSTADASSPGAAAMPAGTSSPMEADTLKIEEVQSPATGTRKAKVLYDYDAADSSELSLLADEVGALIVLGHCIPKTIVAGCYGFTLTAATV